MEKLRILKFNLLNFKLHNPLGSYLIQFQDFISLCGNVMLKKTFWN